MLHQGWHFWSLTPLFIYLTALRPPRPLTYSPSLPPATPRVGPRDAGVLRGFEWGLHRPATNVPSYGSPGNRRIISLDITHSCSWTVVEEGVWKMTHNGDKCGGYFHPASLFPVFILRLLPTCVFFLDDKAEWDNEHNEDGFTRTIFLAWHLDHCLFSLPPRNTGIKWLAAAPRFKIALSGAWVLIHLRFFFF